MNIYVASSWRNAIQPVVVQRLRESGHEVYDFRNPAPGNNGFHWGTIDENWRNWTPKELRAALRHPIAVDGFNYDMDALRNSTCCVLVLPAGRSAHLEMGWATASFRRTFVLALEPTEPELMYSMCTGICTSIDELIDVLPSPGPKESP